MTTLGDAKMSSLKDKLEEKVIHEEKKAAEEAEKIEIKVEKVKRKKKSK